MMGWLTTGRRPRHIAKRIHLTACETPNKSRNIANGTTFALNFTPGFTQRYIYPTGETPCDHSQSKTFWPCLVVATAAAAATRTMAGAMATTTLPAVRSRTTVLRTTSEKAQRTRPGAHRPPPTQMSAKASRKCPEAQHPSVASHPSGGFFLPPPAQHMKIRRAISRVSSRRHRLWPQKHPCSVRTPAFRLPQSPACGTAVRVSAPRPVGRGWRAVCSLGQGADSSRAVAAGAMLIDISRSIQRRTAKVLKAACP